MSNYRGKKASILDLSPHMGKKVRVRFQGGREVVGVLRGYDPMVNIVVDEAVEYLRSAEDPYVASGETRARSAGSCAAATNVTMCAPEEGLRGDRQPLRGAARGGRRRRRLDGGGGSLYDFFLWIIINNFLLD